MMRSHMNRTVKPMPSGPVIELGPEAIAVSMAIATTRSEPSRSSLLRRHRTRSAGRRSGRERDLAKFDGKTAGQSGRTRLWPMVRVA